MRKRLKLNFAEMEKVFFVKSTEIYNGGQASAPYDCFILCFKDIYMSKFGTNDYLYSTDPRFYRYIYASNQEIVSVKWGPKNRYGDPLLNFNEGLFSFDFQERGKDEGGMTLHNIPQKRKENLLYYRLTPIDFRIDTVIKKADFII